MRAAVDGGEMATSHTRSRLALAGWLRRGVQDSRRRAGLRWVAAAATLIAAGGAVFAVAATGAGATTVPGTATAAPIAARASGTGPAKATSVADGADAGLYGSGA